jgi:hypothetical protein
VNDLLQLPVNAVVLVNRAESNNESGSTMDDDLDFERTCVIATL